MEEKKRKMRSCFQKEEGSGKRGKIRQKEVHKGEVAGWKKRKNGQTPTVFFERGTDEKT